MKLMQCKRCGGELEKENGRYVCAYCHATYEDDTLERAYAELKNSLESVVGGELKEMTIRERERSLANLRKELWKETHEKYVNSKKITKLCREIKKISPDDFATNFYELMNDESDESRRVCEFLNSINVKQYSDYVEDVVDFVVKSLKVEYLTSLNGLVERAYKNDLQTFTRVMTKIEAEAEKVESGLYTLTKPREVFVAYSSKDIAVVNELVSCLEEQGIECFVAMRNLQHGAKAVENYEKALETAMDNCKIFLFVSSKNSRRYDCDAVKREIPYVKQKDLENHLEYRSCYDKLPEKYKMPRVQYRIDDVKTSATDKVIKEFFGTLQWRCDLDSVAEQVGVYINREVGDKEEVEEKRKFEEEKRQLEEKKRQFEEDLRKLEEEKRKIEEIRKADEKRKAEQARQEEEKRKAEQAKANAEFEIENGVLKKYNGKGGDVVIPNEVTSIGDSAFNSCSSLTSVQIPNGVTEIGFFAFFDCSKLTSVIIPNSVSSIGNYAFSDCSSLIRVTIPNSVSSIGNYAFSDCSSLTSVTIPNSVTTIGNSAFSGCSSLTSIVIPSSVTNIGERVFVGCNSLKIYAEERFKPSGWRGNWNPYSRPVVWGYKAGDSIGSTIKSNQEILQKTKNVVLRFMQQFPNCGIRAKGVKQAEIFNYCGFSWGYQENATESNQQYWIVACLKALEYEKLVQQDIGTKYWRLTIEGAEKKVDISEFKGLKVRQAGEKIREQAKNYVYDYMKSNWDCARYSEGLRQAELFRCCGFDWGEYEKAESPRQQYWIIGLLRTLEKEGLIHRDNVSKKWRLT